MTHEFQKELVLTPVSGGVQLRKRRALRPTGLLFWDFFAFLFFRLSEKAVLWGTLIYDRIFIPLAAAARVCAQVGRWAAYELRFLLHSVHVALGRLKANRVTAAALVASLTCVSISATFYSFGFSLTVNGKPLGYVMDPAAFDRAVLIVEQRMSTAAGHTYVLRPDVKFSFGLVERDQVLGPEALQDALIAEISEVAELYVLTVDGEVVGASNDRKTLEAALEKLKGANVPGGGELISVTFGRDIQIAHKLTESKNLCSADELAARLTENIHEKEYYAIRRGDTLSSIARKNGVSVAALQEMNPGVTNQSLVAGKSLLVKQALPFVSVRKTVRVSEIQTIPFTTTQVESADLYRGSSAVRTAGVNGSAQVTADVTYENDQEVARNQLSYTVLREPVNQVVAVGTKALPVARGANSVSLGKAGVVTGRFRRPVSGAVITSNYGYRRREFHTGVDFASAKGTPVCAADGGTVSFAGWKGDYGYLVIINHGNGRQTYYGHNSKLLVRAGQRVAKGQQVAKMGSTGRSTGPHCHFEVRVNGKHVNPWRYIS